MFVYIFALFIDMNKCLDMSVRGRLGCGFNWVPFNRPPKILHACNSMNTFLVTLYHHVYDIQLCIEY